MSTRAKGTIYSAMLHLIPLLITLFIFPFAGILVVLILWVIKKDKNALVDQHGRASLKFQAILIGLHAIFFGVLFSIISIYAGSFTLMGNTRYSLDLYIAFNVTGNYAFATTTFVAFAALNALTIIYPMVNVVRALMGKTSLNASSPSSQKPEKDDSMPASQHNDNSTYGGFIHIAPLVASFIGTPLLGLLVAFAMWTARKDDNFIDHHGRETMRFQLFMILYAFIGIMLFLIVFPVGLLLLIAQAILGIVCPIIGCSKAFGGEYYAYPFVFSPRRRATNTQD